MSKIFTLVLGVTLIAFTVPATVQAQFSENFNTPNNLSNNCWILDGFAYTQDRIEVISGNGSLYSNPPVNNNGGSRNVSTPFLNITNNSLNVNFQYKLSDDLRSRSERTIEVGLLAADGTYTQLDQFTLNSSSPNPTEAKTYNRTFNVINNGAHRLVIRTAGSNGDGNNRIIFDDLRLSANALYNANGTHCNSAPIAHNDTYSGQQGASFQNGSLLGNDTDPNGESLRAELVSQSPDGTVVLNPNGNFTFTPNPGFTGNSTTFTYRVRDNGPDRLASNEATVTMMFASGGVMPVKLVSFQGTMAQEKASLTWQIADNENAQHFEVERSTNGVDFKTAGVLFASDKSGAEQYRFSEKRQAAPVVYYRLRMWDREGEYEYSNVVKLYTQHATAQQQQLTIWQSGSASIGLRFHAGTEARCQLLISDLSGRVVNRQTIQCTEGSNLASINMTGTLRSGVYLVQLQAGGSTQNGKLLIP